MMRLKNFFNFVFLFKKEPVTASLYMHSLCVYMYMYVCVYVWIYIYIYIYIYSVNKQIFKILRVHFLSYKRSPEVGGPGLVSQVCEVIRNQSSF